MERDRILAPQLSIPKISTHTLTWSVTLTVPNIKGDRLISTHTLTWSVTALAAALWTHIEFQLTRSRGA